MKSVIALTCAGWLAVPGAQPSNTAPLAFGMTPQDVATVLKAPLTYVSGRPEAEIYYVVRPVDLPVFYRIDKQLYLQFRKGCLTGWKPDWRMPPRGLF
jgi:hypothetical protein